MFRSNPRHSWRRPIVPMRQLVPTRQRNADAARLKISELSGQLKIAKSHYTSDSDSDRQQTAIPLVRALRNFAEGWGEFGKYQEQDKDRIESYTKQKGILETALAISRKGADHEKIAEILRKSKDFNYSLKSFDKNDLDEEWVNSTETVKTLHKLGNVHYNLKDYKEAEKCYKKVLEINENTQLEITKMLREFVNAHYSSNRPKVKEYYEKIANINENTKLETAHMLFTLIKANYNLNDPEEVKRCDEKVLEISKRIICVSEAEIAEVLNNLGSIDHALEDYPKAQEHFEKALPIFKKLNGSYDIKVGMVLCNMGRVYRSSGDIKRAKESFEKALPIYKYIYGSAHIEVGITLNELGSVVYSFASLQKENEAKELYEKAKNLHQEALPIYERFYGLNHVQITEVLGNLDRDYYALKNYQEAQKSHKKELIIYHRDLAIKEKRNPNSIEVAEALRDLGNTYYNLGNFQNAIGSYKRELEIREQYHGSDVVEIAKTLDNLGDAYLGAKDYQKAKESFKRALVIEEKHYGSDNPIVVKTSEKLKNTAESLTNQLKETLAEKERNYPTGHFQVGLVLRDLVDACGELADVYGKLKDYQNQNESLENQKKLLKKALPILKENFGPTNTTVVRLNKLAHKLGMPSSTLDSTSVQAASHSRSFF